MHLSAQATIKLAPDELVAGLAAIAAAPTAAAVLRRVNEMMVKVKTAATGAPGVRTSFRDYAVFYIEEKPPHWTAQQTVEVRGGEGTERRCSTWWAACRRPVWRSGTSVGKSPQSARSRPSRTPH